MGKHDQDLGHAGTKPQVAGEGMAQKSIELLWCSPVSTCSGPLRLLPQGQVEACTRAIRAVLLDHGHVCRLSGGHTCQEWSIKVPQLRAEYMHTQLG